MEGTGKYTMTGLQEGLQSTDQKEKKVEKSFETMEGFCFGIFVTGGRRPLLHRLVAEKPTMAEVVLK
jgi:hypothetical protein